MRLAFLLLMSCIRINTPVEAEQVGLERRHVCDGRDGGLVQSGDAVFLCP